MSLVLEELGYSVRSAEDGHSALREIRRQIPDILLSDLAMPGMSGFELLINVRRLFPVIQVIATSGSFSGNEIPDGVLADAFYPKGGSLSTLLQILESLPQMHYRTLSELFTSAPHPGSSNEVFPSLILSDFLTERREHIPGVPR
jgi:CheY-like chemotaxis protein